MKTRALPLARTTAIIIAAMLLLSVSLTYLGVNWYANHLEDAVINSLPPPLADTYRAINNGGVPDAAAVQELLRHLASVEGRADFDGPSDFDLQMSVLVCSLLSASLCSLIGVWLARRIAHPLQKLALAAESLKSGDFSARVGVSHASTREVASLVESFNALATSLETMEERLRFNNMAVAHELRTPVTILRGSIHGMLDGVFPMERKTMSNLLVQVEGLSRLIEDLRTLSLAIGQKLVLNRAMRNVAEDFEIVLESAKPMLEASGLEVETRLEPAPAPIDAERIRQALLALLENACRYAAAGKILRCETSALPDGGAVIRLIDNGPGFPADMQTVAANPFWRGDPSRSRATGGTGLGLSVVRAIATAHGGSLELENGEHGGAVASVVLPN
ncbi:ATP-binding protein [Phyllobacterium leguminum]|uniref:histidine kinase n=1 Tax=Phyllobacterium leguminum TaxID=314237 RepID=A0A318T4Z3_9HYPH|nr:ATP-binding protein [Phyllobacterium leguminum]PYE90040.1 two-component system sensor histidine kinase AdeS [Phyllobacterium leguminum]